MKELGVMRAIKKDKDIADKLNGEDWCKAIKEVVGESPTPDLAPYW